MPAGLTQELIVIYPATGSTLQRVPFPADNADEEKPVAAGILSPNEKTAVELHWPRVFAGWFAHLSLECSESVQLSVSGRLFPKMSGDDASDQSDISVNCSSCVNRV